MPRAGAQPRGVGGRYAAYPARERHLVPHPPRPGLHNAVRYVAGMSARSLQLAAQAIGVAYDIGVRNAYKVAKFAADYAPRTDVLVGLGSAAMAQIENTGAHAAGTALGLAHQAGLPADQQVAVARTVKSVATAIAVLGGVEKVVKTADRFVRTGKRIYAPAAAALTGFGKNEPIAQHLAMPKRKAGSYKRAGKRPAYSRTVTAPVARARVGGVNGGARVSSSQGFGGEIRVSHRELVRDIPGSVNFSNLAEVGSGFSPIINPGNADMFPFLSKLATQYQKYYFHSLKFSYQPACSSSTDGTVVLAVDYEPDDPASSSKIAMMAKPRAQRTAPWQGRSMSANAAMLMNNGAKYVASSDAPRPDGTSQYDAGNFELATAGQAATTIIGELVVEYSVSLMSPTIIASSIGTPPEGGMVEFQSASHATTGQTLPTLLADPLLIENNSKFLTFDAVINVGDLTLSNAGNSFQKAPVQTGEDAENAEWALFTTDAALTSAAALTVAFKNPGTYRVCIPMQRGHTNNSIFTEVAAMAGIDIQAMATGGVDRIYWINKPAIATNLIPDVLGFISGANGQMAQFNFVVQTTSPWAIACFTNSTFNYNGGIGVAGARVNRIDPDSNLLEPTNHFSERIYGPAP